MKENSVPLEKIKPRLKSGRIIVSGDDLKFARNDDQRETILPKNSRFYLEQFVAGKSVEEIINETYRHGSPIDFAVLQQTLLTLYWSNNLANKSEFQKVIEFSEWLPSIESHLINPIFEFDIKRDDLIGQILALIIPVALIVLSYKIFSPPNPPLYSLFLFPLSYLNIKGIVSALSSAVLNRTPQLLSLQVSFLGVYLKESSGRRAVIGVFEYLLNLGTILLLSTFSIYYFLSSQNELFRDLGAILSVLVCCLLMSPAHKTDFSDFYSFMDMKFKDKIAHGFLKTQLKIMFLNSTALYLLLALSFFLLSAFTVVQHKENLLICAIVVALGLGFFLDLLDDFDFILDQFQGRFISPVRTFFSHFSKKSYEIPSLLKNVSIFETLPQNILNEMATLSKVISVRKGVVLCKEGQQSTNLYLVIRGRVGIYKDNETNQKFKILELQSGSIFGEGGFFLNKPRSGDAITLTNSLILKIKRPAALAGKGSVPTELAEMFQKKIWAFQALSRSSFFRGIPTELLMQIVTQSKLYVLPERSPIVRQGELSDSMWIILEGAATVEVDGHQKRELATGDVFGEIGVIWNTRRTSSVIAINKISMLRIESKVIHEVFATNLDLGVALQHLGASRLESDPSQS